MEIGREDLRRWNFLFYLVVSVLLLALFFKVSFEVFSGAAFADLELFAWKFLAASLTVPLVIYMWEEYRLSKKVKSLQDSLTYWIKKAAKAEAELEFVKTEYSRNGEPPKPSSGMNHPDQFLDGRGGGMNR